MSLTVGALWRYPIQTLAGEALTEAQMTLDGIVGDRIVHVRGLDIVHDFPMRRSLFIFAAI